MALGFRSMVEALVGGHQLSRGDLAKLSGAAVDALLAGQDEQRATLARIEAKLDRVLVQDFHRSFDMGLYRLRDASAAEVSVERPQELIESARDCFVLEATQMEG